MMYDEHGMDAPLDAPKPKKRGFAAMHPDAVRAIAKKGGISAHAQGTAHEFSSEEARRAGALGGRAVHAKRKAREEATHGPTE